MALLTRKAILYHIAIPLLGPPTLPLASQPEVLKDYYAVLIRSSLGSTPRNVIAANSRVILHSSIRNHTRRRILTIPVVSS